MCGSLARSTLQSGQIICRCPRVVQREALIPGRVLPGVQTSVIRIQTGVSEA